MKIQVWSSPLCSGNWNGDDINMSMDILCSNNMVKTRFQRCPFLYFLFFAISSLHLKVLDVDKEFVFASNLSSPACTSSYMEVLACGRLCHGNSLWNVLIDGGVVGRVLCQIFPSLFMFIKYPCNDVVVVDVLLLYL